MLRVLKRDGIDLLALARNAGAFVRMLERFYCSRLETTANVRCGETFANLSQLM